MKILALLLVSISLYAQGPAVPPQRATVPATIPGNGLTVSQPGQYQGSVAEGQPAASISLSLQDAIDRGLKNNLGLLVRTTGTDLARVERIRALSALLPTVGGNISETLQQINLATFGFHFPGVPTVIGPFGYTDLRVSASQNVFDWTAVKNRRSAAENERAAQLSVQDARDLVVQAVASAYLQIISDQARIDATKAQVATAQALYERARDQHQAGVSPAIDELRAQVELKTQQQVLISEQNQLDKDKLSLGRAIGLPSGQVFALTEAAPYSPLENLTPDDMLKRAYDTRADYKSGLAQVRAAEISKQAAIAQRYPALDVAANYGDIGVNIGNSHGTFAVTGSLKFNVYDGGRIRADIEQADAIIKQRKDELADVRGQIDQQVRSALIDLNTARDQVAVARDNVNLADQTLTQARDRFAAGVADNIEVVQAQESVAGANQSLISAILLHNLAKVSLARAVGAAETSLKQFMGSK
ncbi:MAG: TolC family protein [Acidobacteriia bacterium]|nr:TolC family protein [Terriglobia bacterium]